MGKIDWNEVVKILPMPKDFFSVVWMGIGWQAAKAFGTRLDEEVLEEAKGIKGSLKRLLDRTLHFIHHWWIGALLMIYTGFTTYYPTQPLYTIPEVFWFGFGLFCEDAYFHLKEALGVKLAVSNK